MVTKRLFQVLAVCAALAVFASEQAMAYTIHAGISLDVHQDIPDGTLPGGRLPNDFHIEGQICTENGVTPVLSNHLDDIFPNFTHSLTKLNPGDPDDCWYTFSADWWLDSGEPGIPFCTVVHLGLLFFVEDENTMIDLVGWWTLDGQRVGDIIGGYTNGGFVPVSGFWVDPTTTGGGPVFRIGVGDFPPLPPMPPAPNPIEVMFTELDILSVPSLPDGWFGELYDGGAQNSWPWLPVNHPGGGDINPGNPTPPIPPDSFFDVFFDVPVGTGEYAPDTPVSIPPDGLLIVRSKMNYVNNAGVPYSPTGPGTADGLWTWHIHQAQGEEACCFEDGSCLDLVPIDCVNQGGFPQGMGTDCATTFCPTGDTEACCYPDGSCMDEPAGVCLANGGVPQGPGTDCATAVCDPQEVPSASGWGLLLLSVSLVGGATLLLRKRVALG